MTRVRSAAQRAPQTKEQALPLAARFAAIAADLALISADRAGRHAAIDAELDALAVPLANEQADIVKQLKPWWAANVDELTGGKRKSIELGGAVIGYRISSPSVYFAGGKDDAATDALVSAELLEFVRIKQSPDKPAILSALGLGSDGDRTADDIAIATRLADLGFSVRQPEQFFVDAASRDEGGASTLPARDEVA